MVGFNGICLGETCGSSDWFATGRGPVLARNGVIWLSTQSAIFVAFTLTMSFTPLEFLAWEFPDFSQQLFSFSFDSILASFEASRDFFVCLFHASYFRPSGQ